MKADESQKAKKKGNSRNEVPKRQKRKEMKAKMKGHEGLKRPKWKEMIAQKELNWNGLEWKGICEIKMQILFQH